ncbi:MAG: YbjN domain-containing protein [Desulfomonilaceae bacterium]
MGRLIETVNKAMTNQNFAFSTPEGYPHVITSYARYQGSTYYLVFQEFEDMQVLQMRMIAPQPIPPEHRLTASQFLTRVNLRFRLGFFALDLDDGEVSFRLSYDLEDTPLSEKLVMNMIHCGIQTIAWAFPAIMSICFGGKSDLEALQELDGPRVGVEVQLAVNSTDAVQ